MGKCPFWSDENSYEECYEECPMKQDLNSSEECVFEEFLEIEDLDINDEIEEKIKIPLLSI